jgi:lipopolysaccharide transport protein LptA
MLLLALASAGLPAHAAATSDLAIGVASFEEVGPPGADFPDVARMLADRLGTRGVGHVAGPDQLGGSPAPDPTAEQLQAWGRAGEVSLVVVGRTTRLGRSYSLDVHLYPAAGGAALATRVAEAGRVEDLQAAVVRLADQLVKDAAAAPVVPAVSARGAGGSTNGSGGGGTAAASAAVAETPEKEESGRLGFGKKDDPIDIQSRELEMLQNGAERRFVFKGNVHVTQGTMTLTCRKLEALYPDGSSKPERLVATGRVVLTETDEEGKKQAFCDRATFMSANRRVICRGEPAELQQGEDCVRGKEVEFDLGTSHMVIRGGADVRLGTTGPCEGR